MNVTKEEAIKILTRYDNEYYTPATRQAHRMAVEALREQGERKQVQVDEKRGLREKLIELLENDDCPLLYVLGENVGALADHLIANGVTVQRWIPATERLPESGKDVLIITSSSDRNMAVWRLFRSTLNGQHYWEDEVGDGLILGAATHWMPLPEPPKEGE